MCLKSDSMDIPQNLLVFSFLLRARKDNQCSNIVWGWGLRFVKQVDFFFSSFLTFFFTLILKFYLSVLIPGDKNNSLILLSPFVVKTVSVVFYTRAKPLGKQK